MIKRLTLVLALFCSSFVSFSQVDSTKMFIDSLEASLQYQKGEIKLNNGIGTLNVPSTFGYLDQEQARFVLESLWGNPEDSTVLGMIVPDKKGVLAEDSWAFIITYDEMGFVKDDDADDINYDEMLEEMQNDASAANHERQAAGYEPIEIIGWASKPYYDADKKVLHWAKEIKFGENEFNTLNYNIRVLGRKGVLVLNAVAPMSSLAEVQTNIEPMLSSFTYADGYRYSDFNPDVDEVAAWTVGGLVAGKLLAKAGFFAIVLKYLKVIIVAVGAAATGLWRWYKKKTTLPEIRNIGDSSNS